MKVKKPTVISMKITNKLSQVELARQVPGAFLGAFEGIVAYASRLRSHKIPEAEIDVTQRLAGPLTRGGLFILLLEPRLPPSRAPLCNHEGIEVFQPPTPLDSTKEIYEI